MLNLSLSGCGFLGIYHVGVISAFREHASDLLKEKISGCSAGALVAACAMCDCCLGQMVSDVLEIALKARSYALGPLHPSFSIVDILRNGLRRILPIDAHRICSGRVHISLTRWRDGKHYLVNQFESREDLIQALICSSFVPAYSGFIPPKFRGTYFWDGGLSNNNPVLDEDTIIVSPFGGEADICPRDESASFFCHDFQGTNLQWSYENIYRLSKALFPPNPEVLKAICFRGYKDAMYFLKSRNLLQCSCNRSWEKMSINSMFGEHLNVFENTLAVNEEDLNVDDLSDVYDSEEENLLQYANNQPLAYQEMPASVCDILDAACNDSQGLFNFIYDSQLSRVISILILPWTLPLEFCMNLTKKMLELVPKLNVPANPSLFHTFIVFFNYIIKQVSYDRYQYHTRMACKLCNINSIHGGCCHRANLAKKESSSNTSINNLAVSSVIGTSTNFGLASNQINIINATPSKPQPVNESMTSCLKKYSGETNASYYYYPKICARHRVPSVCSSETTGVASGSVTSASASIRFNRRRHKNQTTGYTRRSMSGAASNASDIASSVDLNEYRSSKLSRKRSSRSVVATIATDFNNSTKAVNTTIPSNQTNLSHGYSHQTTKNISRGLDQKMKMHSNTVVSSDINKANLLLNSTPMSTPPTPITGHKVHFHLNYTTDDEENSATASMIKTTADPSNCARLMASSKNETSNISTLSRSTIRNSISITNPQSNVSHTQNNNELLLQWESYWDTLEYNCLGRINIDF